MATKTGAGQEVNKTKSTNHQYGIFTFFFTKGILLLSIFIRDQADDRKLNKHVSQNNTAILRR